MAMMNETTMWILAFLAGGVLGAFFFGGLWWTVQRGVNSSRPVIWFLGSALVRTLTVLVGFYVVSDGEWQRLLLCVLGFTLVRPLIGRLTRSQNVTTGLDKEVPHAP